MAWKSFLAIFFGIFLFLHIGCSSSSDDDSELSDAEVSQQDDVAESDEEFDEDEEDVDDDSDEEESIALEEEEDEEGEEGDEEYLADEDSEEEEEGEEGEEAVAEFDEEEEDEAAEESADDLFAANEEEETPAVEEAVTEEVIADEAGAAADLGTDLASDFESGPDVPNEVSTPMETASAETVEEPAPQPQQSWIPVKKIKSQTYNRAGFLVNAVYIARPGDSVRSIGEKIYGVDRSSDLLAINPHLRRGVDPGDKLYYNSPNRPQDTSQILPFAADSGIQPQYYQTKSGDNIRTLAKQLMGYRAGWKEIWATNPDLTTEEKWALRPGHNLQYWPSLDGAVPATNSAQPLAAAPEPQFSPDQELAEAAIPPPPANEPPPVVEEPLEEIKEEDPFAASDDIPELNEEDEIAADPPEDFENLDDPFAEPDGSEDLASLGGVDAPPSESQPFQAKPPAPSISTPAKSANNDLMMLAAAAGLILIGVGGLVVARKKRLAQKTALDETSFVVEDLEKTEVG